MNVTSVKKHKLRSKTCSAMVSKDGNLCEVIFISEWLMADS